MMKLSIEAKKGKGIDELLQSLTPQLPEQIHQPTPQSSSPVERILQKYQQFCQAPDEGSNDPFSYRQWIQNPNSEIYSPLMLPDVLTPPEINTIVQALPPAEIKYAWPASDRQYRRRNVFVNKLIQNSYTAGYNYFILCTETLDQAISLIYLQGTSERPLTIEVQGAVESCSNLAFTEVLVLGKVNFCGEKMWSSSLSIQEKTGHFCPDGSSYSLFTLREGISTHATRGGPHPQGCTFKTGNQRTLELWRSRFTNSFGDFQFRLIYIHPDGNEEVVHGYDKQSHRP